MTGYEASRRNLLYGLAAGGVALPAIAACGGSTGTAGAVSATSPAAPGSADPSTAAASGGIKTTDIPVGGGTIFASDNVVITQPTAGQFKAFSAICTHQGCPVSQIQDGAIICPCHFSAFSIKDGSVLGGPAPSPLQALTVTVTGDTLKVN